MARSELDRAAINQAGEDILTESQNLFASLGRVREIIDSTKSAFDSEDGNALRNKFNQSAQNFETFKKDLDSYGEYCKTFASNVESIQNAVKEVMDEMPSL